MASKRTKNRLYWLAVKAITAGACHVISPQHVYKRALQGVPDSRLMDYVTKMEYRYGPARLADVSNSELWPAREIVDAIRNQHQGG